MLTYSFVGLREREREREKMVGAEERDSFGFFWSFWFPSPRLSPGLFYSWHSKEYCAPKKKKSGARTNFRFSKTPHQQMSMRIFAPSYDHFSVGSFLRYFLLCKTGKGRGLKLQSLTMNIFRARQRTIKKSRSGACTFRLPIWPTLSGVEKIL